MYCAECGEKLGDDARVCPKCGTSVEEKSNTQEIPKTGNNGQSIKKQAVYRNAPYQPYYPIQITNQPVSVLRWIGRELLPFIPFVGVIVNFIMLIVWACTDKFEETSKNWAIATLIITLIRLILGIILIIAVFSIFAGLYSDPQFRRDLEMFLYNF